MKKLFSLIFLLAFAAFAGNTYLNNDNSSVNPSEKLRNGERQFVYAPSTAVQMISGDTLWIVKADTSTRAGHDYDGIDNKVGADSIITWFKLQGHEADTVNLVAVVQHADKETDSYWVTYSTDTLLIDTTTSIAIYRKAHGYIPGSYWRAMLVLGQATDTANVISVRRQPKY